MNVLLLIVWGIVSFLLSRLLRPGRTWAEVAQQCAIFAGLFVAGYFVLDAILR